MIEKINSFFAFRCKISISLLYLFYFVILITISLFFSESGGKYLSFSGTSMEILSYPEINDPKYFITAAIDIANNGWISSSNDWIFNLWPPGFILLEACILKLFGFDASIIFILQVLASFLYAAISIMFFLFLRNFINYKIAIIAPFFIFIFPMSRTLLLGQIGISLGESFSVGFFLIFILLSIHISNSKSILISVFAGLFLGLTAYFRSYFETILLLLTIWGIIFIIFSILVNKNKKLDIVKSIFIILFIANLLTIPWRIYHKIYQNSFNWVQTSDLMLQNQLKPTEYFIGPGGFISAGGGNTACRLEPSVCGKVENAKQIVIKTYLNDPIGWYRIKFENISDYWFSSTKNWVHLKFESVIYDYIIYSIILFMFVILNYILFKIFNNSMGFILFWINISLSSAYFIIFTFAHFEARYFYFPKIYIVFLFLIAIAIFYKKIKKERI